MKNPYEGRRRWKAKEPKKERPPEARTPLMAAMLRSLILLMFGVLVVQLINLQVIQGSEFKEQSAINAIREVPLPAARGLIYDRNGKPLVENSARFSVSIVPGDLPDRGEAAVFRQLGEVIGMTPEEVAQKVADGAELSGEFNPTLIKGDVDRDTALILMELEPHAPGLQVNVEPSRRYLTGDLLSHVLGYVGPITAEEYAELADKGYLFADFTGKSGVEYTYEDVLRGRAGTKLIKVDSAGRELETISERRPIDGNNVVLSIDLDLQQAVTDALREYSVNSQNAAAAVMDINTGEILAMASLPTFDNNVFSGEISQADLDALVNQPGKPLVNHVIAERYPPGSTFKTIVGSGALQEGVASPSTTITSRGYISVENEFDPNVLYIYPDWAPLGTLDFYSGLAMSSNVYFYYLSGGFADDGFRGLGEERVAEYARGFGLGSPTGIDLPGESAGLVPDAKWKEENVGEAWTLGDTYNFGIGQGYVAATPLQMLDVAAAIGNGGKLLAPRVVKEYQDSMGNVLQPVETQVRGTVPVDPGYLTVIRDAMRQSVTSGVARNAAISGTAVAGKTGTAEFGVLRPDGKYDTHGWFIGFAPYEDPQIAVMVFVEKGSGGNDASPAASEIFDYYFNGINPNENNPEVAIPSAPTAAPDEGEGEPDATPQPTADPNPGFQPAPAPLTTPLPTPTPEATPVPTNTPVPTDVPVDTPVPTPPPQETPGARIRGSPP